MSVRLKSFIREYLDLKIFYLYPALNMKNIKLVFVDKIKEIVLSFTAATSVDSMFFIVVGRME